jgi:hypothetical protein
MKKDYFILELFKSRPFILLIVLALLIFVGVVLINMHKDTVYMKEDIMYIAPKGDNN